MFSNHICVVGLSNVSEIYVFPAGFVKELVRDYGHRWILYVVVKLILGLVVQGGGGVVLRACVFYFGASSSLGVQV